MRIFDDFYNRHLTSKYAALYFDFRGHGSSKVPSQLATISGMCLDFFACLRWLKENEFSNITIIAASFGAGTALLCNDILGSMGVQTMVFWNPVISYQDTFVEYADSKWAKSFFANKTLGEQLDSPPIRVCPRRSFPLGLQWRLELRKLPPGKRDFVPGNSYFMRSRKC